MSIQTDQPAPPCLMPVKPMSDIIPMLTVCLPESEAGDSIRCVCTKGESCHGYSGQCYNGAIEGINGSKCTNC